ncbi:kinase-like protein [Westerdykella ornata]|uniref:Kinase-like protein n=1 Tax=Westerdykella ornata TaxID=318751 RepID=A0A6A6JR13_WESOR|nr:kinase-like protein [Westerdykella ornata]KAF2278684.1 kinase-like protein [Westerdykella ornata]
MIPCPICVLKAARMLSTRVGQSGRDCNNRPFVLKPVSQSIFEHLQEFRNEFENHTHLRIHIDQIEKENIVVYEYFKTDLLSLVENYPALPITMRKTILKEVGLALAEISMHAKNWIHLDVKPNNFHLEKLALGDLDCALKLKGERLLNDRTGNVMWRSPEGQRGKGVGKPSEVFSFALLCLYVITGVQIFDLNFEEVETEPEVVVYALKKHVNVEKAGGLVTSLWQAIRENEAYDDLAEWSEDVFPNLNDEANRLILRMTDLNPARRAPLSDTITERYWNVG